MNNDKAFGTLGILIAVGLIGAGYEVSNTLYKAKLASNIVTVKGFAERSVKADLALWTISFTATADNLDAGYDKSHKDEALVTDFLIKKGMKSENIKAGNLRVTDLLANQYRTSGALAKNGRYIIQNSVSVRSEDIALVEGITHELGALVKQGIVLGANTANYQFTKLNDVKPEMLREATKNARNAAEQFAQDSGNKVGSIQSANQGFFSIVERDSNVVNPQNGESQGGEEYYSGISGVDKKIRVVTTVAYYLDK